MHSWCADTTEKNQCCESPSGDSYPCGQEAKQALTDLIGDSVVSCEVVKIDKVHDVWAKGASGLETWVHLRAILHHTRLILCMSSSLTSVTPHEVPRAGLGCAAESMCACACSACISQNKPLGLHLARDGLTSFEVGLPTSQCGGLPAHTYVCLQSFLGVSFSLPLPIIAQHTMLVRSIEDATSG